MDECSSASKKLTVSDAILWLKSAWDIVKPTATERCFARCGFVDALAEATTEDKPAHMEISSEMEALLTSANLTWEEYRLY